MSISLGDRRKRRGWLHEWWDWRKRRPVYTYGQEQYASHYALWMLDRPSWRR